MSQENMNIGAVNTARPRNNVLDLLRGHFLLAILITHFYKFPSPFVFYFGRGELWVSAAPGFVFISGLLVGMMSKKMVFRSGYGSAVKRLLRRGFKLYIISVIFTVSYSVAAAKLGDAQYLNEGHLHSGFLDSLWNALILNYSYGWADLLLYYSIMIFFVAPIVLVFIKNQLWHVLLLLSGGIWLLVYLLPGDQAYTGSFLPVESWQFLFVIAMVMGFYKEKVTPVYRSVFYGKNSKAFLVWFFAILFVTLGLSIADRFYDSFAGSTADLLDRLLIKKELGPGLILMFFYWFTATYYVFQRFEGVISKYMGWLYLTFGKNSLLTYSVQSIFLFIQFYLPLQIVYWWNTFNTIALILIVWLTVRILLKTENLFKNRSFLPK